MEVFVNRRPVEVGEPMTLAELLVREGIPAEGVAVAVNNRVVPRAEWAATPLGEQMKITVIRAVCGG
ncbi:sulfur carrier protein ThiS [uncultured Alistipes sp.]|uniref:sulfur carrier protein ThiS n=1 Tax=uncultured Alistipes sp. TaxID=538949 RepID=UPI002606111F|nr:sulfur carrier protein ThiS [uncultured Alistipes sp.]